MREKLCVFAGTTEGRRLAQELCGIYDLTVCVATQYGKELLDGTDGITVLAGRMTESQMEAFIRENGFSRVIDATHPYAVEAAENIHTACERTNTPLLRISRKTENVPGAVYVDSAGSAGEYLAGQYGNILLTTGAKELGDFAGLEMSRVWARVLPTELSLKACEAAGIAASHIIAMQGPFSRELNGATLRQIDAKWLVTKATGAAGGFDEKIAAARAAGTAPVIIGRPPEKSEGVTLEMALELLLPPVKRVSLIGIGPGGADMLTVEARRALDECDAVIGAAPVLDMVRTGKPKFAAFLPEDVRALLENHRFRQPAVVLRGDVGFYSGAGKIHDALSDYDVTLLPGIASPVYFAAKLGISWDSVKLISLHGREAGIVRTVLENRRVIALTGGENTVAAICGKLCEYGLGGLAVTVGERLTCPGERVTRGTAAELSGQDFDSLSILLIENPDPRRGNRQGIPDGEFICGNVPVTKSEVRSVCLSKLALDENSVVWDIGAGTGSVSVECALAAREGTVYAIERSDEACALIRQNAVKFHAENINLVEGTVPETLDALPAPTHVFIGGASGGMRKVIAAILRKAPAARIAATAVTLEIQAELTECAREFDFEYAEAVSVSVARSNKMARCHLMTAQSSVMIFTMQGGSTDG